MRVLSVGDVTRYLKQLMEADYLLNNLWIKGEISNYKRAVSGHLYFTLKDENSTIRVVMFRSRAIKVPFIPENGMCVRVRGYISLYERDGIYQLYAQEIETDGLGSLHVAFEKLKEQLKMEGLFDEKIKKAIPRFPKRVGIVTSPTGAVIKDMTGIMRRRWPAIEIILAPVKVQGFDAPKEIDFAIRQFNNLANVDVIIVGRGGGSLEELWAFNTERVARSIFRSEIPVISAVGHDTDYTISDMVADLRAPTPSAAAELSVPDSLEMKKYIQNQYSRLIQNAVERLREKRIRVDNCLSSSVMTRPLDIICNQRRLTMDWYHKRLTIAMSQIIVRENNRMGELIGRLESLSPLATLARGYAICMSEDGKIIRSNLQVSEGSLINLHLHKGYLQCEVKSSLSGKEKIIPPAARQSKE